jgi:hypothetical protein
MKLKLIKLLSRDRISGAAFITRELLNDSFSVKRKGLMVTMFARMLPAIGLGHTKFRLSIICYLIKRFFVLYKNQGMKGLVIYLKATTVILQQTISEFKLYDMSGLNTRIARGRGGLPRIITNLDRVQIAKGNTDLMRFYLTIFNLYRILEFPGKLKLKSITDPFKGNPARKELYNSIFEMGYIFKDLIEQKAGNKILSHGISMDPILKSSPGANKEASASHPMTLLLTAQRHKVLGTDGLIMYFAKYFEKPKIVRYPGFSRIFQRGSELALLFNLPSVDFTLGKLGLKEEAAGKIRVFAMVDAWTNWVLAPLHKEIFRILKYLPTDGTFDQLAPVKDYRKWPSAYSLDLTAATDRLPISLQIHILSLFYGKEFAVNWARLLVDRDYSVAIPLGKDPVNGQMMYDTKVIRYAVGQPMGALSSWAMLALTHHYIVNVAAWQIGFVPKGKLYSNYAILGDDLVIGDRLVKDQYLRIVDALGVECGLHKSVLSSRGIGIEFAKKTFFKGVDVSPVPILEFLTANYTLPSAISFAHKYSLTLPQLVKSLGYGYKVLGRLDRHIGTFSRKIRLLYMAFNSPLITSTPEEITAWLGKGNPLSDYPKEGVDAFMTEVVNTVNKLVKKSFGFRTADYISESYPAFRDAIWSRFRYPYMENVVGIQRTDEMGIALSDGSMNRFWTMKSEGTEIVPPSAFNRIENDFRDLELWHTQVLSNLVGPQVGSSRDTLNSLEGDMTRLGKGTSLPKAYVYSLLALKEVNNVNVITDFKRVEDELKPRMDVVQIKLWRLWTNCFELALKKAKFEASQTKVKET